MFVAFDECNYKGEPTGEHVVVNILRIGYLRSQTNSNHVEFTMITLGEAEEIFVTQKLSEIKERMITSTLALGEQIAKTAKEMGIK